MFIDRIIQKFRYRKFYKKGVSIGEYVEISGNTQIDEFCGIAHHASVTNCIIGKRSSIGRYSKIRDANIGSYCSISWDVTIGAVNHPLNNISTHAFAYRKQFGVSQTDLIGECKTTTIGNDVWIGCGAIILSGIKIGHGAIIGAGAIVTKDVEPYAIVAGVPAALLRYRFDNEIIKDLLRIQWWNFSDKDLKDNLPVFQSTVNQNSLSDLYEIYENKNQNKKNIPV